MIAQDIVSVWVYRRDWSRLERLKVLPGAAARRGLPPGFWPRMFRERSVRAHHRHHRDPFVLYDWFGAASRSRMSAKPNIASRPVLGHGRGLHLDDRQAGGPPFQIHVLPQRLPKMASSAPRRLYFAAVNCDEARPITRSASSQPRTWRLGAALLPLADRRPIFSASGWCASRRPRRSTASRYALMFLIGDRAGA